MCSFPETDDLLPHWVAGKAVGYCSVCTYQCESASEGVDDRIFESDTDLDERSKER